MKKEDQHDNNYKDRLKKNASENSIGADKMWPEDDIFFIFTVSDGEVDTSDQKKLTK